ncbi:hypothetical protein MFU01_53890 [Myxococcus fulvus]|uniref:Activator of Hsp90 ATPase homologue 1/2-like C-terminal domain-containing protein n=1 Tax=Myxococcus fulvus TaxID=33 RepID=A0A511TA50_MYXFU|nr:SRPBCC family protein [Myxococcus fulvus]GEN10352.1 hypothetical protein MFU01_53890 [Myxococcus fulvus]
MSRVIAAPPARLYQALLDPEAVTKWLPPEGMTARLRAFEPRPGGAYRLTLTYDEAHHDVVGKSSAHEDAVEGVFVELVPDQRVVQRFEFDSGDPSFAGRMTMTWTLTPVAAGTEVSIHCVDVPEGIRQEDHVAGMSSTLENLAAFVE